MAALCVIHPKNKALYLYKHLGYELKIKQLDFLLPDYTHLNYGFNHPSVFCAGLQSFYGIVTQ